MPDEILNLLANTYTREYRNRIARCGVLASACVSGIALFAVLRFWYPWWGVTLGAAVGAGVIWFALKHGIPALPPTRPEIAAIIDQELASKDRMGALVELEGSPALADTPQRHLIARQLAALIPQLRQLDPTRFDRLAPLRLSPHDSRTLGASALLLVCTTLLVWLRPLSEFEQLAETLTQIVEAHPELPAPVQARTRELVQTLSATTQDPAAIAAALKRAQEELSQPLAGGDGAADSESLTLQAPDTDSTTQGSSPSQGGGASPQQAKPNKASQPRPEQQRPEQPRPEPQPLEQQQAQQQAPPQPPQQRDPQHRPERAQGGESTQQQSQQQPQSEQPQQGQGQQSQPQQGTQGAPPQDTQQQPSEQPQSAGGQGKESKQEQQGGAGQSESSSQGQQGDEKKEGEKQEGAGGQKKGDQKGQQGQGNQGSNQGGAGGQGAGQNPDSQGNADGNNGAAGSSGAQAGQQQGKAGQAGKNPGSSTAQGGEQRGEQGSNPGGQQGSGSADQQGAHNAGTDSQTNPAQSAPEQLNQAFSKVQQSLEKKGQSGSGQGSSEQREGSQGSSGQNGTQPPSGSNPSQNPSQRPQESSGGSKDSSRNGLDGSQGSSPKSPSGPQQPPSARNNRAGADPAAGDQGTQPPPPGSNDPRAERGGSRDGSGERSALPDRNAATRTDDPNGTQPGGESGLGGRQGFKESRIQGEGEQFDTRFTGGAAQRERNSAPAEARTSIEDVLIAKPKGSRDRGAQPIPLEYKEIFQE